jgi:hypothetical protein
VFYQFSFQRDESPRKKSNECSYSQDGFGGDIEEGEFVPDTKIIKCDVMLGPRKRPESHGVGASSGDDPGPTTHDHMNEPENQYESRQQFKRIAKPRGMKGGTCCSLVVLRRLYQVFQSLFLSLMVVVPVFFIGNQQTSFFCKNHDMLLHYNLFIFACMADFL